MLKLPQLQELERIGLHFITVLTSKQVKTLTSNDDPERDGDGLRDASITDLEPKL